MKKILPCLLSVCVACALFAGCGMYRDGNNAVMETPYVSPDMDILPDVSPMISPDLEDGIVEDRDGLIEDTNGVEGNGTGTANNGTGTAGNNDTGAAATSPSPAATARP